MKRLLIMMFLALAGLFMGCTTPGGSMTRNDQIYAAAEGLAAIQSTTKQLLAAGQITKVQAQQVADQSQGLQAALSAAEDAPASAPASNLATVLAGIASLQAYLATFGAH